MFQFFCEVFLVLSALRRHGKQICFISSSDEEHSWLPVFSRLCVHTTHVIAQKQVHVAFLEVVTVLQDEITSMGS